MSGDPIIDEVRAIRDDIAREHNYNLSSIFEMLRRREAEGTAHVKFFPQRLQAREGRTRSPQAKRSPRARR